MDFLSVLFMISFAMQELLSLVRFHLLIFVFIFITLGGRPQKDSSVIYVKLSVLTMLLSSNSFRISSLTFRPLINFEFIFVCDVRECSDFILYMYLSSFSSLIYWKDCKTFF